MNGGAFCLGAQIQKSPDCISCPDDMDVIGTDGMDVIPAKKCKNF